MPALNARASQQGPLRLRLRCASAQPPPPFVATNGGGKSRRHSFPPPFAAANGRRWIAAKRRDGGGLADSKRVCGAGSALRLRGPLRLAAIAQHNTSTHDRLATSPERC